MRLIRNITPDGRGKYALVRLDKIRKLPDGSDRKLLSITALDELAAHGFLEHGEKGGPDEHFVLKLKDINASVALRAYAAEAYRNGDSELAFDVADLANRSDFNPNRRMPD